MWIHLSKYEGAIMMTECSECGRILTLRVLQSPAGYYMGFFCPHCGPYDRLTDYFPTREAAEDFETKQRLVRNG